MEELIAADIRLVNAVQRITTPIESPDISLAPVVFFIWPDLPQWIAYIFPTHYFMKPLYEGAIKGTDLVTVLPLHWTRALMAILSSSTSFPIFPSS